MQSLKDFITARPHATLTTGEVVRMLRELKGWSQAKLAKQCGVSVIDISHIENEKMEINKRYAELIANAFDIHPAIIMFPEYEMGEFKRVA